MEIKVGDIFFATTFKLDAKWHITGEFTSLSSVKIHRLWRDDNLAAWPLDYKVEETKPGRVVTAVQIGERKSTKWDGPVEQAPWFRVDNRKHIFHYNLEEDEQRETKEPTLTECWDNLESVAKGKLGDVRLSGLIHDWKELRKRCDRPGITDEELTEAGRALDEVESRLIGCEATSALGILCKIEALKWYTSGQYQLVNINELQPLVESIENDVQNLI